VTIDKSGPWWKGADFADLDEYLRQLHADGYPVGRVLQSVCACGRRTFRLEAEPDEGGARRTCVTCDASAFIGDSADYWDEGEPQPIVCPCGSALYEVGVGFAFREDGDVRWISVGVRCTACGVLSGPVDWKIDYGPTDHLLHQV
jgi:hypothetical protein